MKKKYVNIGLSFLMVLLFSMSSYAQNGNALWTKTTKEKALTGEQVARRSQPTKAEFYQLNIEALKLVLQNAPERGPSVVSDVVINFPNVEGKLEAFRVMEASIMHPDLQANFPDIRSYVGQSIANPSSVMRFSVSTDGLHTMTLSTKYGTQYIDPFTTDEAYIVYSRRDLPVMGSSFECGVTDEIQYIENNDIDVNAARNANDGQLRTYRLAMACTVEYAAFHGNTTPSVLAAMNTLMNRVNGVYERDFSVTMQLVANNTAIIFIGTDNFDNNNAGTLIGQSQTEIDGAIGSTNYDIGHTVSTGGGGLAGFGVVCVNGQKASGITGLPNPIGDAFAIDFVSHEMGHQFGGSHTFNGSTGNCAGGNRSAQSAYEPGSGSTIMAYAGICSPQNVQNFSNDYFHRRSIEQISANILTGNASSCSTNSATGNAAPTAEAGLNYNIPISTPYKLTGSSTDVPVSDETAHTYTWEQFDLGPAGIPTDATPTGPMVRSFEGTTSPVRYIPRLQNVIANGGVSTTWEKLASVGRLHTFELTVRDNDANGGQTASDNMTVTTISSGGAFTIATPPTWGQGSTQTVNWNLGVSNVAPINATTVNILFSSNGGTTFTTMLASNVPNDGSQDITVPSIADTNNARILVEAADNIFYNVSEVFSISNTPDFGISSSNGSESVCNMDMVTYNLDYVTSNGFSETTTFSATGNPAGSNVVFAPTSLNSDGSFAMEVNNLLAVANGDYNITVTATSPSIIKNIVVTLTVVDGVCASVANTTFQTSTTGVIFNTISNLNTGKPSGYGDYTAMSTDVNQNSPYDLTINVNTDGNYPVQTKVWVDWNQNCSFNDTGEEYDLGQTINTANGPTGNSPLSITVPAGAVLGNTIMRVSTKYVNDDDPGLPMPCLDAYDGETEDYTINVLSSLSVADHEFDNFSIFPNPNTGEFTVKLNSNSGNDISLDVFDIRGRKIFNNAFANGSEFNETIKLNNVQSGLYLVTVKDGDRKTTKKIVIE